MSKLIITTKTGKEVHEHFCTTFCEIADGTCDEAPINMTCIDPLLDIDTEESRIESEDIQNMAVFMLIANKKIGVTIDERIIFADCDDALVATFGDEWQLEYPYTMLKHIEVPTLKNLFKLFTQINNDCMRACEDTVPLTDKEYYSEQIQSTYDLPETDADKLADQMRKFSIFQASGKDVENIGQYSDAWEGPVCPGRVYLADNLEKCGLVMSDTTAWANAKNLEGKWYLQIGNQEWMSDDLEELEFELFDFASSAGWTDNL